MNKIRFIQTSTFTDSIYLKFPPEFRLLYLTLHLVSWSSICGITKMNFAMLALSLGLKEEAAITQFESFCLRFPQLIKYDVNTGEFALLHWAKTQLIHFQPGTVKKAETELLEVESGDLLREMHKYSHGIRGKMYLAQFRRNEMQKINLSKELKSLDAEYCDKEPQLSGNEQTKSETKIEIERETIYVNSEESEIDGDVVQIENVKTNAIPKETFIFETPNVGTYRKGVSAIEKEQFDKARLHYKKTLGGVVRGNDIEYSDFKRKNKGLPSKIIPLLIPAIDNEKQNKLHLEDKKEFVPSAKNYKTWLNQECWTQEFETDGVATSNINTLDNLIDSEDHGTFSMASYKSLYPHSQSKYPILLESNCKIISYLELNKLYHLFYGGLDIVRTHALSTMNNSKQLRENYATVFEYIIENKDKYDTLINNEKEKLY